MGKSLNDLKQDQLNLNQGSESGAALLDKSLEEVGYARSMVMSADGVIICGNQTQKAALRRGDGTKEPIIIETDGDVPVIVKRKDVMSGTAEAIKIAAYDNLANQRGLTWRPDSRRVVEEHGVAVEEIGWTVEEIPIEDVPSDEQPAGDGDGKFIGSTFMVSAECSDENHQRETYEKLSAMGYKCKVMTL